MTLEAIVNEDKVAAALDYLAATDEKYASLKADVHRTDYLAKLEEAFAYKAITVGTVNDKLAEVQMSPKVQAKWTAHYAAVKDYELVRARRERAIVIVDLYRTLEASRRKGNI